LKATTFSMITLNTKTKNGTTALSKIEYFIPNILKDYDLMGRLSLLMILEDLSRSLKEHMTLETVTTIPPKELFVSTMEALKETWTKVKSSGSSKSVDTILRSTKTIVTWMVLVIR
jgi:hypothetical protein